MTKVLLAIDDPLYGKAIENFVVNHRWAPGTKFKLMHAIEPLRGIDAWPEGQVDTKEHDIEMHFLSRMASRIANALPDDHEVTYEIRNGFPKEEIMAEAQEWPAQMIVMGSHGRNGLQRFLLGSVSLAIITHAPCSVVLIRLPKEAALDSHASIDQAVARDVQVGIK